MISKGCSSAVQVHQGAREMQRVGFERIKLLQPVQVTKDGKEKEKERGDHVRHQLPNVQ